MIPLKGPLKEPEKESLGPRSNSFLLGASSAFLVHLFTFLDPFLAVPLLVFWWAWKVRRTPTPFYWGAGFLMFVVLILL